MKDKCIRCGIETAYDESTHIDHRVGYIEGAGQLCINCHKILEMYPEANMDHLKHIVVPVHVITQTPNDQELGTKVRSLYWESQK